MAFDKVLTQASPTLVAIDSGGTVVPTGGTHDLLTHGNSLKLQPTVNFIRIRHHSTAFTRRVGIPTDRLWAVNMTTYMQGSGALGTAAINGFASISALLQSAAMTLTTNAGTSLVYTPSAPSALQNCVIYNENDGALHIAHSCVGNVVLEGTPTDGMALTYTGQGVYAEPTLATISNFSGGTDRSEAFLSIAGTITPSGGTAYTPVVSSIRFDRGIQIGKVGNANTTTGVQEFFTRDAEPTLTVVIAQDNDASAAVTYNKFYTDMFAKTVHNVTFTQGTTTGNKAKFAFPQAQITNITRQEGDGYALMTLEYAPTHTTDNSEFSITIT